MNPSKKSNRLLIFLVFLVVVISVLACSTPSVFATPTPASCYEQSKLFFSKVDTLLVKWDDTKKVAEATSRIALSPIISSMQDIKREAEALEVPQCAQKAKDKLIDYMNATIDSYLSFMANDDDQIVQMKIQLAQLKFADFLMEKIVLQSTPTPNP